MQYDETLQRLGGREELFREFVEIFMSDSPEMIDKIARAVEGDDSSSLEQTAHTLHGLMLNFGANPCCDLAQAFEQAGQSQSVTEVASKLPELRQLYEKLCTELTAIVNKQSRFIHEEGSQA